MELGIHHSIISVDIADSSSSSRDRNDRTLMVGGLRKALEDAFEAAQINRDRYQISDRGDGCLILVHPEVPKYKLSKSFVWEFRGNLLAHNDSYRETARIQVRMALHSGDVILTGNTEVGEAIEFAARLRDADEVKSELLSSNSVLAVVASDQFYQDAIRSNPQVEPRRFHQFNFSVKNTNGVGWLCVMGEMGPRSTSVATPGRESPPEPPSAERQSPPTEEPGNPRPDSSPLPGVIAYPDETVLDFLRTIIVRGSSAGSARRPARGSGDAPTIALLGSSGSGKTLTLETLRSELERKHQPHVLLDAESLTTAGHRSEVADLVIHMVFGLLRTSRPAFVFPRSILGAAALSMDPTGTEAIGDLKRAAGLRPILENLARRLAVADTAEVIQRVVSGLTGPGWTKRWQRTGHDWYGMDNAQTAATPMLRDLVRTSWDRRPEATRTVLAAFLADVADLSGWRSAVDPVIMIDNADGDLGRRFLHAWQQRPRDRLGGRGRATLVVAGNGQLIEVLRIPAKAVLRNREDVDHFLDRGPRGPVALSLWGLDAQQLEAMARHAGLPPVQSRRIGLTAHRVTGGNLAASMLLIGAAKTLGPVRATVDDLLNHLPGGRRQDSAGTVAEMAVDSLLKVTRPVSGKGGRLFTDLVTCSAARTREEAMIMMRLGLIDGRSDALSPVYWCHVGEPGKDEMDPLVRLLLLRWLAARPVGESAPATGDAARGVDWNSVFGALAEAAKDRGDEKGYLYHLLATGRDDEVAARLTRRLSTPKGTGKHWLTVADAVAMAPAPPGKAVSPVLPPGGEVRLLMTAWRASNDVYLIDEWADHHALVAFHLRDIGRWATRDHDAFQHEAERHEAKAAQWRNI